MAETISELKVAIGADLGKLQGQLNRMEGMMGKAGQKSASSFNSAMGSIQSTLAGVFSIGLIEQFLSKSIQVTAEFEKMGAVLTTAFGSSAQAQLAMMDIVDFASKTPFQVSELTDAFTRFANRGLKPSMAGMTSMGDLSAALGKDFSQLTEAILDVSNTERWNELGLKVKSNGDKIIGTFRGVTLEFERTEAGAMAMAEAFGNLEGVTGGMTRISETLGGKLSNLADNFDVLLLSVGKTGFFANAVDALNSLLLKVTDITKYLSNDSIPTFKRLFQLWNPLKFFTDFGEMNEPYEDATKAALEQAAAAKTQVDQFKEVLRIRGELNKAGVKYDASQSMNLTYLSKLLDDHNLKLKNSEKTTIENAKALDKWTEKVNAASEAARAMEANILGEMFNMDFQGLAFGGQIGDVQIDLGMMDAVSMEVEEAFENMDLSSQRFFDNLQAQSEAFEFLQANAGMIGGAFQSAFDAALISGENFMEVLGKSLEQLIQRLASAAITAGLLSLVFSSFGGGSVSKLFPMLFSQFGGFELEGNNLIASERRTQGQNNRIL